MTFFRYTVFAFLALTSVLAVAETDTYALETERLQGIEREKAIAFLDQFPTLEVFLRFGEAKGSFYKEPGENGVYIVDGDIALFDEAGLATYYQAASNIAVSNNSKLAINTNAAGELVIWDSLTKGQLTYCVSNDFGSLKPYVARALQRASQRWEVADIDLHHRRDQDADCTAENTNVLFDVRPTEGQPYLARAFFPGYPRQARNILIDQSALAYLPNERAYFEFIMVHELGHVLGFRHEHTVAGVGSESCFEDHNYASITLGDKYSKMAYPQCVGVNTAVPELSQLDEHGAACAYGAAGHFTRDESLCRFSL